MQNPSTVSRHCNTRAPSWAEDFIDLTEFCQPSTIPIKMEDSVDECTASPIPSNNTVNTHHGFDYALEVNDPLDNNIDDTLWRMPSPAMAMQDELCDPLTDWLSVTKETNNNNNNNNNHNVNHNNNHHHSGHVNSVDNLTSQSEISYNISEALLSSRLMSVPNSSQQCDKKSVNYVANEVTPSHQLHQSEATFYATESAFSDVHHSLSTSTENLMLSRQETSTRLPSANSLFIDRRRGEPTISTPTATYGVPSHNQFLDMKHVTSLASVSTVGNMDVQTSRTVQSPSITQSTVEPSSSGMPTRRNSKLKLNISAPVTSSSCNMPTAEMLQPLVTKNSDFDLVSYVFDEHNKPSVPLDVSSLNQQSTSAINVSAVGNECRTPKIVPTDISSTKAPSTVTIKTEPKDEMSEDQCGKGGRGHLYGKHRYDKDEEDQYRVKRLRRYSNCSSEDLTQLESEKYRELRNKNNEASRRSRANRKNREVEMREYALNLEADNRRLKVKAEEMEKLVKRLRNCLMQLVLKRR